VNSAHVLAWLTCLALAFFACILGVRNAGSALKLERDIEQMKQQMAESDNVANALYAEQVRRIHQSLGGIKAEMSSLKDSKPEGAGEDFEAQVQKLQDRIEEMEKQLAPLLGGSAPPKPEGRERPG
jgi:hypothetical protein